MRAVRGATFDFEEYHPPRGADLLVAERISENRCRLPDGSLLCLNVPIARLGEMEYRDGEIEDSGDGEGIIPNPQGKIWSTRTAEDLFGEETILSFEGVPVTLSHPPVFLDTDNYREYGRGFARNVRPGQGEFKDFLLADLVVRDAAAIDAIEKGGIRGVSPGYSADYIAEGRGGSGKYLQTNIRGNHIAIVREGRGGQRVRIRDSRGIGAEIDSFDSIHQQYDEGRSSFGGIRMRNLGYHNTRSRRAGPRRTADASRWDDHEFMNAPGLLRTPIGRQYLSLPKESKQTIKKEMGSLDRMGLPHNMKESHFQELVGEHLRGGRAEDGDTMDADVNNHPPELDKLYERHRMHSLKLRELEGKGKPNTEQWHRMGAFAARRQLEWKGHEVPPEDSYTSDSGRRTRMRDAEGDYDDWDDGENMTDAMHPTREEELAYLKEIAPEDFRRVVGKHPDRDYTEEAPERFRQWLTERRRTSDAGEEGEDNFVDYPLFRASPLGRQYSRLPKRHQENIRNEMKNAAPKFAHITARHLIGVAVGNPEALKQERENNRRGRGRSRDAYPQSPDEKPYGGTGSDSMAECMEMMRSMGEKLDHFLSVATDYIEKKERMLGGEETHDAEEDIDGTHYGVEGDTDPDDYAPMEGDTGRGEEPEGEEEERGDEDERGEDERDEDEALERTEDEMTCISRDSGRRVRRGRGRAHDSLGSVWRHTRSLAEVMAPGLRTGTRDAASSARQQRRSINDLRRHALLVASQSPTTAKVVDRVIGRRSLGSLTTDSLFKAFNDVGNAVKAMRGVSTPRASTNDGSSSAGVTVKSLQQTYDAFWKRQS